MTAWKHALMGAAVGAVGGVVPDAALSLYGWRRRRLPADNPLVRVHRFLHGPGGLVLALLASYGVHLVADRYTRHPLPPWLKP